MHLPDKSLAGAKCLKYIPDCLILLLLLRKKILRCFAPVEEAASLVLRVGPTVWSHTLSVTLGVHHHTLSYTANQSYCGIRANLVIVAEALPLMDLTGELTVSFKN